MNTHTPQVTGADLYLVKEDGLRSVSAILVANLWQKSLRRHPHWGFVGRTHQGCSPVRRVGM